MTPFGPVPGMPAAPPWGTVQAVQAQTWYIQQQMAAAHAAALQAANQAAAAQANSICAPSSDSYTSLDTGESETGRPRLVSLYRTALKAARRARAGGLPFDYELVCRARDRTSYRRVVLLSGWELLTRNAGPFEGLARQQSCDYLVLAASGDLYWIGGKEWLLDIVSGRSYVGMARIDITEVALVRAMIASWEWALAEFVTRLDKWA